MKVIDISPRQILRWWWWKTSASNWSTATQWQKLMQHLTLVRCDDEYDLDTSLLLKNIVLWSATESNNYKHLHGRWTSTI